MENCFYLCVKLIIDTTGKEIVPIKYDSIQQHSFDRGLVAVELNGKFGFVDKNGKEVVPIIYDAVEDFQYEYTNIEVEQNGETFYIDKQGNRTRY